MGLFVGFYQLTKCASKAVGSAGLLLAMKTINYIRLVFLDLER